MLLHQIRTNYNLMTEVERHKHIYAYRVRRFAELDTPSITKKEKGKKTLEPKEPKAKLSAEEKVLLKKLGLSLKVLKILE